MQKVIQKEARKKRVTIKGNDWILVNVSNRIFTNK